MGVHGLWPLLEPTGKPVNLSQLEGKRLAVDISLWLHQAQAGYSAHGIQNKSPHLSLLIHRIAKLLFYKIRPVFVFDGDQVPVFKRQVLRERAMKKHLDEIQLNTRQKKLLEKLAKTAVDVSKSPEKKRAIQEEVQAKFGNSKGSEDLFELPEANRREVKKEEVDDEMDFEHPSDSLDYLAGYEALTKDDERINFLIDAKEKAKTDRIRIEDIPEDSMDFSRFQLERLVKRNQINVELEKIKTEKQQQLTRITSNDVETIVIDPHFQGHILRKHDVEKKDNKNSWDSSMDSKSSSVNTSMEGKSKEFESKKVDESKKQENWNSFLSKIKEEYDDEDSDHGTGGFNYTDMLKRFDKREKAKRFESDEEYQSDNKEGKKMMKKAIETVQKSKHFKKDISDKPGTSKESPNKRDKFNPSDIRKLAPFEEAWTPEMSENSEDDYDSENSDQGMDSEAQPSTSKEILKDSQMLSESSSDDSDDFIDVSDGEEALKVNEKQFELNKFLINNVKDTTTVSPSKISILDRVKEANPRKVNLKNFNNVIEPKKKKRITLDKIEAQIAKEEEKKRNEESSQEFQRDLLKRKHEDDWVPEDLEESEIGVRRDELDLDAVEVDRIDDGVYKDCQYLLSYLGLPYITAPGEAEAQCVCLERLGLCDGIITEDSDAWLFGAETIYRHMFHRSKEVSEYCAEKIYDEYGLGRPEFIAMAMLAGGDYTKGFDGVGTVTALELCAELGNNREVKGTVKEEEVYQEGLKRLNSIGDWLKSKKKFQTENPDKVFKETATKIRLRRQIESKNEEEKINLFPNVQVYEAYARPLIDTNAQHFKWEPIDFDQLYQFVYTKVGYNEAELKRKTHNALHIWQNFISQPAHHYQMRISAFLRKTTHLNERPLASTKRVEEALKRMQRKKGKGEKPKPPTEIIDDFYDDSILEGVVIPGISSGSTSATVSQPETSKKKVTTKKQPKKSVPRKETTKKALANSSEDSQRKNPGRTAKKVEKYQYEGPELSEESD